MKVIITGATGMVGKGVLLECLAHKHITNILTISRGDLDIQHDKLENLVVKDFSNFSLFKETFTCYDACFLCMGVSAAGMNTEKYRKITFDYTISLAEALPRNIVVTYVSGQGTDSAEKRKNSWSGIKGATENALLAMKFRGAYMFRPGIILPENGIKSKTASYQFFYNYFTWLIKLVQIIAPKIIVSTTQMGQAMINAALYGYEKNILNPADIIILSNTNKGMGEQ